MKKVFNIISYSLNVIFIVVFVLALLANRSHSNDADIEQIIKTSIIERERAELPIKLQRFDNVYEITIDSLVLTSNVEPFDGYLVTTWDFDEEQDLDAFEYAANGYKRKYIRKTKTMYVELQNIRIDDDGSVEWIDNWTRTYIDLQK